MSSAVLTALLVLQVFIVYGTLLVLNGAVGESIVLPTDEERPMKGPYLFMQWRKNYITVVKLTRRDSSTFETKEINENFAGRLIMNYETGALNISSLREEDSGEYVFNGLGSFGSPRPKTIQLHVYERIVSVQVTSEVKNTTDNSSCNVILSCNVIGGSQVALSWSRNGDNIAGAENRTTLTVSPTHAEEDYTCTAINPIGSLSNTVRPCQTPGIVGAGLDTLVEVTGRSEIRSAPGAQETPGADAWDASDAFWATITDGPHNSGLSLCALKLVLFPLGLVAMVSAVIAVHARERCCRDQFRLREKDKPVRGEEIINI